MVIQKWFLISQELIILSDAVYFFNYKYHPQRNIITIEWVVPLARPSNGSLVILSFDLKSSKVLSLLLKSCLQIHILEINSNNMHSFAAICICYWAPANMNIEGNFRVALWHHWWLHRIRHGFVLHNLLNSFHIRSQNGFIMCKTEILKIVENCFCFQHLASRNQNRNLRGQKIIFRAPDQTNIVCLPQDSHSGVYDDLKVWLISWPWLWPWTHKNVYNDTNWRVCYGYHLW